MVSKRGHRGAWLALLLGALGSVAQGAHAEEPDAGTRMAARELAVSGAEAFDKQDFATALDRFQRAESLYKVPSIAVMVARTLARVGQYVEAVDKYEETLRMPLDAAAPEAFQRAVADAKVEVEGARAKVARLELRVPVEPPAGLEVLLDDKPLPAALLGVPIPVNPGTHRIAARAPGHSPFSYEASVPEGGRSPVELALSPLAQETHAPAPAPPPPTPATHRRPSTLSIALLAGGGVALAAGAVTGIAALNHKAHLEKSCTPGCPPNMSSDLDGFRRDRTLSYLGFGVGIVAAGVGTYFLLHDDGSNGRVGLYVRPAAAGVAGSF